MSSYGPWSLKVSPAYAYAYLEQMMVDPESELVEREETFDDRVHSAVRQAICAFANDLPDHRRPGVILIGVNDDGTPTGLEINDALFGSAGGGQSRCRQFHR